VVKRRSGKERHMQRLAITTARNEDRPPRKQVLTISFYRSRELKMLAWTKGGVSLQMLHEFSIQPQNACRSG